MKITTQAKYKRPQALELAVKFLGEDVTMNEIWKKITVISVLISATTLGYAKDGGDSLSITELLAAYSKSTSDKVISSEDVKGSFNLFGINKNDIKYPELLTILDTNGFTAYKSDGHTIVISADKVRYAPIELVQEGKDYPLSQYVTEIIKIEKACAIKLIPLLRPLVKKTGHMAGLAITNTIVLTDKYSNILRIKGVMKAIDSQFTKPGKCSYPKKKKI